MSTWPFVIEAPTFGVVDAARVQAGVVEHGAVLLRVGESDPEAFGALLRSLVDRPFRHGDKRRVPTAGGHLQRAAKGQDHIELHCEQAFLPTRPDLAAFLCLVPPRQGGETLVCDGTAVYRAMAAEDRELFAATPLLYRSLVMPRPWARMLDVDDERDLPSRLSALPNFAWTREDAHIDGRYTVSALTRGLDASTMAFANSVLAWKSPEESARGRWVALNDGRSIAAEVRARLEAITRAVQVAHRWSLGEALVLDNWRVMHGRNAFEGERSLLAGFGYARWCGDGRLGRIAGSPD